jgi:DeoR/GlpR family transcriptional regulator of sugar metabolism
MKRTLAGRAVDTYVLASTEKVGAISAYKVLSLSDVTAVVTDAAPDDPMLAQLSASGTDVIHAA